MTPADALHAAFAYPPPVTALVATAIAALWPLSEWLRRRSALRALREMPPAPAPIDADGARFAGVDVLQAVRSGDPTLEESLRANLRELCPHGARLHWLLDEDDAAAHTAAHAALDAAPALCTRVRIGLHPPCPHGANPKLFKLDGALGECPGRVLVVLDDDARLPATTLDALLAALPPADRDATPRIATALPAYLPARNLASRLLAAFVDDNAALTYLPPRRHGSPTINGMAWAIRRPALAALGGFAPRLHHLTDDLAMAQAVLGAGGRIEQRSEPVWMRTELPGFAAYLRQMHRWMLFAKLLLATQAPAMRVRILLGQGLPALLPPLAVVAFCAAPHWLTAGMVLSGAALHAFGRAALQRTCTGATRAAHPLVSLCAALLLPLHLAHAWLAPTIRWREHRYRVFANDRFEELP